MPIPGVIYLKLNSGDTYKIDDFTDVDLFLGVIDEFLIHNRSSKNYTNNLFRTTVDDGNILVFNALEICSVYVKRKNDL
ncbi:hypothetical protein [Exiguobacterium acetylicum]|uniref:hypothetical protein n=1 Tax=Exiguobacterium acetylicum TaxID=41170 RepID=UPI001CA6EE23|nr:hypothetical protein [Exiguobacterium acetylicum]QZY88642.1 hypothetical protein K7G97_17185 [Exiguobacterium acetylicum]